MLNIGVGIITPATRIEPVAEIVIQIHPWLILISAVKGFKSSDNPSYVCIY